VQVEWNFDKITNHKMIKADIIIGIDPGASGGIAWNDTTTKKVCYTSKIPKTRSELHNCIRNIKMNFESSSILAVVEMAQRMPTDRQYSVVTYNAIHERILTVLEILEINYTQAHPMTWQSKMNLLKRRAKGEKKETYQERKKRLKTAAENLNPNIKVTNYIADALLLHEFGMKGLSDYPDKLEENLVRFSRTDQELPF